MYILNANLGNYRNEEHFQFQTEFKGLVEKYTPEILDIEAAWAAFLLLYKDESAALDVIRKSALTEEIAETDHRRDLLVSGLGYTVKGASKHFDTGKKAAAERILIALDYYGNINRKSYDEQTAAVNSLVDDLNHKYAADISILGMEEWVNELQVVNNAFVALMRERYSEEAEKPQLKMKKVRVEADAVYRTITERINALIIVNGEEGYAGFVKDLNERVERFNNVVSRRGSRNAKKGDKKTELFMK